MGQKKAHKQEQTVCSKWMATIKTNSRHQNKHRTKNLNLALDMSTYQS